MKKPVNKNRQFVENFFANKGLQILVDLSKKKKTFSKPNGSK